MVNVWNTASQEETSAFKNGLQEQEDAMSENARKLAKQLADETENYLHELDRRQKAFESSLTDLVFAHQDKVEEIKNQIAEENDDYQKNLDERLTDFKKTMTQMSQTHQKKVDDIEKQLNRENEDYAESSTLAQQEHDKSIKKIMDQIDKETAKGKNASQTKLRLLQEQLDEINNNYELETASAEKNHDRQVEDLQESLDEENVSYQDSINEKQTALDEANAKELEAHQKSVQEYQTRLDSEMKILNDHQDQVNEVKDNSRRDDIQRLLDQHADENAEALRQHNKRMADLKSQGTAEGNTFSNAVTTAIQSATPGIVNTASGLGKQVGQSIGNNAAVEARNSATSVVDNFVNALKDKFRNITWTDVFKFITNPFGSLISSLLPHFASGVSNFSGGMALVGENGPEVVNLPRGADVIPNNVAFSGESKSGVNQQIYINIDKVGNMGDIDSLGREFGFRASLIPA
jgi:chemotaxis protein histidine kinase CheA